MADQDEPTGLPSIPAPKEAGGADQLLSTPTTPPTTILLEVPTQAVETVQRMLAAAADGTLGALLSPAPAPTPKPAGSHQAAQALVSGLLSGLGAKYRDPALSAAARQLEQRMGLRPASGANPAAIAKPPRKPRRKGKGKRR